MQTLTTDQIRNRIDSGLTGEKIDMPDPAAAPLGTDAEAGGAPPTAAERAMDAAATPDEPSASRLPGGALVYLGLLLAVAVVVVLVLVLALR